MTDSVLSSVPKASEGKVVYLLCIANHRKKNFNLMNQNNISNCKIAISKVLNV